MPFSFGLNVRLKYIYGAFLLPRCMSRKLFSSNKPHFFGHHVFSLLKSLGNSVVVWVSVMLSYWTEIKGAFFKSRAHGLKYGILLPHPMVCLCLDRKIVNHNDYFRSYLHCSQEVLISILAPFEGNVVQIWLFVSNHLNLKLLFFLLFFLQNKQWLQQLREVAVHQLWLPEQA